MSNLREQLESMTVIVADTGDIKSIQKVTPRDATTNPSLILKAAEMAEYQDVVDGAIAQAREDAGADADAATIATHAMDRLAVAFGLRILEIVPGRVSTEVDARLSFDTDGTIAKARHLIGLYEAAGVKRDRILIKIASTWEGIRAAEVLEQEGIHCNLTLLFGLHQAIACAEAGITLISPFVGRILDWHKQKHGRDFAPEEDPGVESVTTIYNYYKKFGYNTEVMGASFRNVGEIIELAGCDLLTIAPNFLDDLAGMEGALVRKLDPAQAAQSDLERITIDRATFDAMHAADPMATDKLAEGIEKFSADIEKLEKQLVARIG